MQQVSITGRHTRFLVFVAFLFSSLATAAPDSRNRPSIPANSTTTPPVIDGNLDDDVWNLAAPSSAFSQVEPKQGDAPSETTVVRILYDTDTMYVAVRCMDANPEEIRISALERDADVAADDVVYLALDTFGRGQEGYYFAVTPGGARLDGLIESSTQRELTDDWDGVWLARSSVDDKGWSAEFAIPTRTLAFDPDRLSWRFNVERVIRRKQETLRWSGAVQGRPFFAMADFGEIAGLRDLRQGVGLTLTPFISAAFVSDSDSSDDNIELTPGLDLVYQITPALAATMSINTDFAETEVDDRIINLTRFPVSLPEKRAFFLQDSPLFAFGGIDYSPYPFFSRSIGLSEDGEPIDLLGGAKIAGNIGSFSIGALGVVQDSYSNVDQKNLFAARAAFLWGEDSSAGFLITSGEPRVNGNNEVIGVDFNHVQRVFDERQRIILHTWWAQSDSDFVGERDSAAALQLKLEGEPWEAQLFFSRYGSNYDPGLGFVSRVGVFEYFASARRRWRPSHNWFRTIDLRVRADYYTDLDGRSESFDLEIPRLTIRNDVGDQLSVEANHTREVLREPFEIRPGNVIPIGDYRWERFSAELTSSEARFMSVGASWATGDFYDGRRDDYGVFLEWRPTPGVTVGGAGEQRDIRLPSGDFDVAIASLYVDYAFSPDLISNFLFQYDNASEQLGFNTRIRWTIGPGRDLFLVLNQIENVSDHRFDTRQQSAVAKLAWAFHF